MFNRVSPQKRYATDVSNVRFEETVLSDSIQNEKLFSWLKNAYADESTPYTLKELIQRLNDYVNPPHKGDSECFLKGLFDGGTSGIHNIKTAPFFFFDIDVKDEENTHLTNQYTNKAIFEALKEIAVLVWHSTSGYGIAGILYTPQIAEITKEQTSEHLAIGKAITSYFSDYLHQSTGIAKIKFDNAQSKFRQVRFIAHQNEPRYLNPTPKAIYYDLTKNEVLTPEGIPIYYNSNHAQPKGSIFQQFNDNNNILDIALRNGFIEVGRTNSDIRLKHPITQSKTSGHIDISKNIYYNHSQSFSPMSIFTPARLECYCKFDNNYSKFATFLKDVAGYKEIQPTRSEYLQAETALKRKLRNLVNDNLASEIIFQYCYNLQTATNEVKRQFIKDNCIKPKYKKYFIEYLRLTDYTINYKHSIEVNSYVSEAIKYVLEYADLYNNIIVKAETGTGKTYAVLNELLKHRPTARILICAPYTMVVDQQAKTHPEKAVFLTGTSLHAEREKVPTSQIIFATYEQATKLLFRTVESEVFNYVIIDEAHNLITANSYKLKTIRELTENIQGRKIIGLTATPSQIFNYLGYELIEIRKRKQAPTDVQILLSNKQPYTIALNHLTGITGKCIIRLNSVNTLKSLKKHLVDEKKYKEKDVVIFHSTKDIKNGKDYQYLAGKEQFAENVKIILTTSLIDEGVNIKQLGFSDVVFIETSYTPRPEVMKQFFARFRYSDHNRKNYLYLRQTLDQTPTRYNPINEAYTLDKNILNELDTPGTFEYSSYGIAGNLDNFIIPKTSKVYRNYLAYHITGFLFSYMNTEQFVNYLQDNYLLRFTSIEHFEPLDKTTTGSAKEQKKIVASFWKNERSQIFSTLYYHTTDRSLKNKLTGSQVRIEPQTKNFILSYQKQFEKLAKRLFELLALGVKKPNKYLIKEDTAGSITLVSDNDYKKEITILRLTATEKAPNETDIAIIKKLLSFIVQCAEIGTLSKSTLNRLLKRNNLHDSQLQKIEVLEAVFFKYNHAFYYNKNTKKYTCFSKTLM